MWCALLVTLSSWLPPAPLQATSLQAEDERALQAFSALPRAEQQEVLDWMSSTIAGLKTFRVNLAQRVIASSAVDEKTCKPSPEPQWFDPKVHAPAQPIARRLVPASDARNVRLRAKLVKQTGRTWEPAWTYHWATGAPVPSSASTDAKAALRVYTNALKGRAPREDWVESLVSGVLDDGSQRTTLAAFAHVYTDRTGLAWEGITLHDAWKSGADIEMPDVDVLGIVHLVRDDWTTWTAPVPASQHERLYTLVGDWFRAANRHRVLRTVCAQAYLDASEPLPEGYAHLAVNMHVLWDEHASDPALLAAALPKPEALDGWLESLTQRVREDPKLWERGTVRMEALKKDAAEVRAVALWVLKEYGAYERAAK
jgi:hypothetical protein